MGKTKTNASVILTLVAGILAIVAAILYRNVMYRFQPVYIMLIAAAVIAALHCFLVGRMPRLAGYCPVCMAPLLASAAVWGSQLMVNQLGYVYAGLDGMGTVMSWIYFMAFTLMAMILSIIASFTRVSPDEK